MSRKKVRINKNSKSNNKRAGGVYMASSFPILDPHTGEIDFYSVTYEVTHEQMSYMPVYSRAHKLMPESHSYYMDPNAYKDYLNPSIEVLDEARGGKIVQSDTILRALGILGHTPVEKSIMALSEFAESNHSLAPVAGLALAECSSMYPGAIEN